MWERADLLTDVATDGFDPARDWVGVFDRERVVGWGLYAHPRRAWADVHPDAAWPRCRHVAPPVDRGAGAGRAEPTASPR